jgi:hypothetical protein
MAQIVLQQQNMACFPVQFRGAGGCPPEGHKAISFQLTPAQLAVGNQVFLDMKTIRDLGLLSEAHALFIDCSGSNNGIHALCNNTGHLIVANGQTQGFYPVLSNTDDMIIFSAVAAGAPSGNISVMVLNFNLSQSWAAAA